MTEINTNSGPNTPLIAMDIDNTDKQQNVEANVIYQMTEAFLRKVTMEQLELLTSGIPDVSTKILLTESTLELISSLTDMVFRAVRHKDINQHCDVSRLNDTLVQSFSKALGIDKMTDNVSIRHFSQMIQKEVSENVKSLQSTGENNNIISPERLNIITSCVLEIFTTFANELMFAVTLQKQNQRQTTEEDLSCHRSIGSSDSKTDKITSESTDSITDITATDIICHLIDEAPSVTFKKVMVETFQQLLSSDEQITRFIFNAQKNKESFTKVEGKFVEYFTVCFTKVWMNHLMDTLSWKDQKEIGEYSDLPQSLIDFVHCHLPNDAEEGALKEHSRGTFETFSGKHLVMFMSEFSQFLCNVTKQQRSYYDTSENDMYDDIRGKVWIFTMLLNWWVNNQMSKVTERMNLAYVDEEIKDFKCPMTEHSKVRFVFILVEKIVLNLCYSLKIRPTNAHKVIERIFENVMDEVQDTDLYFMRKSFKLYKKINLRLLKSFGSPEAVLFLVNSKEPVIEECIISVLKEKMMRPPKKQNIIQRFFSSFCKIFCVKSAKCGCL